MTNEHESPIGPFDPRSMIVEELHAACRRAVIVYSMGLKCGIPHDALHKVLADHGIVSMRSSP